MFAHLDAHAWLILIAILALAGFVKGVIAFGFPIIATPLLALVTDVPTAIALSLLPNIAMDAVLVVRGAAVLPTLRRHGVLLLTGVVGTVVGTHFLLHLPARALFLVMGVLVLVYVGLRGAKVPLEISRRREPIVAVPVGLVSGLLNGLANSSGLPLALYYSFLGLPKDEFVKTIAITFVFYKAIQFFLLFKLSGIPHHLYATSLVATVFTLAAFRLGIWARDRVSEVQFHRATLGFLLITGLVMLGKVATP